MNTKKPFVFLVAGLILVVCGIQATKYYQDARNSYVQSIPVWQSVTSDGRTGEAIQYDLQRRGYKIGVDAQDILDSYLKKTSEGVVYKLVGFDGRDFEKSGKITMARVWKQARAHGCVQVPIEAAFLLGLQNSQQGLGSVNIAIPCAELQDWTITITDCDSPGQKCIGASLTPPETILGSSYLFVFMIPADQQPPRYKTPAPSAN